MNQTIVPDHRTGGYLLYHLLQDMITICKHVHAQWRHGHSTIRRRRGIHRSYILYRTVPIRYCDNG